VNTPPDPTAASKLRRQAEAVARQAAGLSLADLATLAAQSPAEMERALHELRVHQIELEMQNEGLRRSQAELAVAKDRYYDLYDLAPVSYLTVSEKGLVLEANLAATKLLEVPHSALTMQPFACSVFRGDQDAYFLNRQRLFATGTPQAFDLRLVKPAGAAFWTHLAATVTPTADGPRVARFVLSDITKAKRQEAILAARLQILSSAPEQTLEELLRATLDEAEALTGSRIGFYHFIQADQNTISLQTWSTNTVRGLRTPEPAKPDSGTGIPPVGSESHGRDARATADAPTNQAHGPGVQDFCTAEGAGRHYPADQAGVWVDCLRQRRAVIHNNYAALPHRQGLPPGHAQVERLMTVPVLRGGLIVALLGVGNKPTDYTEEDIQAVTTLADMVWDIVEKKRAEAAQQESENRLRTITGSAQDAILMMDTEGRVCFWNPAAERLFGYSSAEALGQGLHALIAPPRYHAAHHAAFPEFLQTGQGAAIGRTLTLAGRHKDGREIAIELSLSAVQVGDAWQAVGLIRDITERQQAAAARQAAYGELEQRVAERTQELSQANAALTAEIAKHKRTETKLRQLSAAVEQSSTSILITNLAGDIEYVNPEFCALTGYTLEEVLGKNPRVLKSGQTSPVTYQELWAALTAGHAWRGEFCNRKKSGELYWEAVAISPIRDAAGQVTHYVGVKNDITERHRLQEALRKSQEEFRAIADYTVNWESWVDPDGKILWVNPGVERVTGYTPAEMIALPDFLATLVLPEDYDLCATAFRGAMSGRAGYGLEFRCVHKNGATFWLSMSWQMIFDAQGKTLGVRSSGHDITQRKQAEQALLESQELLATFLQHAPIYTYIKTVTPTNSRVLMASEEFQQMLGCSGAELVGKTTTELFPPALAAKIIADDWGVVSQGEVLTTDETLEGRTYTTVKFPIVQGGKTLLAGYSLDTTDREQLQAALRVNEKNFRTFFDTVDDLIVVSRPDGQLLYANPPAARKLGYSPDELLKMRILDLYVPAHRRDAEEVLTTLKPGEPAVIPLPLATKSGACLPVETRTWRGEWNGADCIFNFCKDLSHEQAALQLFNRLFESNPALMALTEQPSGIFTNINAAFERVTGYTKEEVHGRTPEDFRLFVQPEEQRKKAAQLLTEGRVADCELQVRCKDGTLRDGLFFAEGIEVQGQQSWLSVMVDITEQKRAQAELAQTNRHLEAASLRASQMAVQAEAATIAKSAFLSTMSHELRTPLSAILGFSEILTLEAEAFSKPQLRYLHNIRDSGQQLLALVNDALDLSRVEAGKIELHWEMVSLADLCATSLHAVSPLAQKKKVTLTTEWSAGFQPALATPTPPSNLACRAPSCGEGSPLPPGGEVSALASAPDLWFTDRQRLKQILLNLLSNAVKFTPEGGSVGLEVARDTAPPQLRLTVWDTGIGLAPADQARAFETFTQIDSELSRQHAGTGLGLPLVRHFCALLGGTVTLTSTLGQGSRFTVTLPQRDHCPAETPPTPPAPAPEAPRFLSAKIEEPAHADKNVGAPKAPPPPLLLLVVDDDAVLLDLCSTSLTLGGEFRVLTASSGAEALRLVQEQGPALIVADIQMPDMDGLELIRRLRQSPAPLGTTPIIALTALAMTGDQERCLAAGADEYLTKPVRLKDLRALIQRRLGLSKPT
jgi:PAS domain S-box-containing protein